jgi:hypothetical protein
LRANERLIVRGNHSVMRKLLGGLVERFDLRKEKLRP